MDLHLPSLLPRVNGREAAKKQLFEAFDVSEQRITDLIIASGQTQENWRTQNRPDYLFFTFILRRMMKIKDEKFRTKFFLFFLLYIYGYRQKLFLPHNEGEANKSAMDYTMTVLSKKYVIMQVRGNSPYASMEFYADDLPKKNREFVRKLSNDTDESLFDAFAIIYGRVHSFTKNIMQVYHEVYGKKQYLNFQSETNKEGSENEANDLSNLSFIIDRISTNVYRAFRTERINNKIVHDLVRRVGVSESNIATVIDALKTENDAERIIRLTITIFFKDVKDPELICSRKFIAVCLGTYSKSYTKEEDVVALKNLLHEVFIRKLDFYNKTEREATKSDYKKALYLYFVFFIQQNHC